MGEAGILHEDDRVELIEGDIVDMTPIGSWHAGAVAHLGRLLDRAVGDCAIVWVQNPVILNNLSEPEPDLALLLPRRDFYKPAHPRPEDVLLIVEVADSSLRYDREVKVPLYARHGIPEVWLVDVESKALAVYRLPDGDSYREVYVPDSLAAVTPAMLSEVSLDLGSLFA